MQISEALIQKFLDNTCTEAEAVFVARYLDKDPGILKSYLKPAWDEAGNKGKTEDPDYNAMLDAIKTRTIGHRIIFRRYVKWISVAASLLLLIGGYRFFSENKKTAAIVAGTTVRQEEVLPINWVTKYNTTGEPQKIALTDGSVVTLSPYASIHYKETFANDNNRDIYLRGEAFFEVAKDKTKPFTVYAGAFATTALGTSFRVTESKTGYSVKLYTGKVVIKARQPGIAGWKDNVYLLPGQQMQYDIQGQSLSLAPINEVKKKTAEKRTGKVLSRDNNTLVFDNTVLEEVLDKLAKRYDRKIDYDKAEINGMYFSGSVLKTDSLPMILKVIARMNGLMVTVNADGFLIKKSQ